MILNTYQQQLINTRYISHIETTLHMRDSMPEGKHFIEAHINGEVIVIYKGDYYIVNSLYQWLRERLTPGWDADFWDINELAEGYKEIVPEKKINKSSC